MPTTNISDDLCYGADQIAEYMFGDRRLRRRIYHLVETGRLPVMRLPRISARKSTLARFMSEQEISSQMTPAKGRSPPR